MDEARQRDVDRHYRLMRELGPLLQPLRNEEPASEPLGESRFAMLDDDDVV